MVSAINQAAVEAITATSYIETYLDAVDHLPNEIQKYITQLREIDNLANELMTDLNKLEESFDGSGSLSQRKQLIGQLNRLLLRKKELGDQKLEFLSKIFEVIDNRSRILETDFNNLEQIFSNNVNLKENIEDPKFPHIQLKTPALPLTSSASKINSGIREDRIELSGSKVRRQKRKSNIRDVSPFEDDKKEDDEKLKRKKKRGIEKQTVDKPPIGIVTKIPGPLDPNEPVYCLCREVSYGEMVGCDNEGCPIEWYHFNCVSLTHKPKGKWYCPKCRGDRPSLLSPELVEHGRRTRKNNLDIGT